MESTYLFSGCEVVVVREGDGPRFCSPSKDQFQRQLDFPAARGRRINDARATDCRSIRVEERTVVDRGVEVRMIEKIEKLRAELHVQLLFDFSVLEQRKIEIDQPGTIDLVAPAIAK